VSKNPQTCHNHRPTRAGWHCKLIETCEPYASERESFAAVTLCRSTCRLATTTPTDKATALGNHSRFPGHPTTCFGIMLDFKVLDPRWLTCGFYPCCYKKVSETAGKYLVSTLDLFTDTRLQGRLDSGRVLGTFLVAYSAGCTDSRQNLFMVMMLDTIGHIIQVCEDMYPYSAGTR
jgi:hypothetical protein